MPKPVKKTNLGKIVQSDSQQETAEDFRPLPGDDPDEIEKFICSVTDPIWKVYNTVATYVSAIKDRPDLREEVKREMASEFETVKESFERLEQELLETLEKNSA